MRVIRCFLFIALLVSSALSAKNDFPRAGSWRGELSLNDSTILPFSFAIYTTGNPPERKRVFSLEVTNGAEHITVQDLIVRPDSIFWTMPVFNTKFRCRIESDSTLSGEWSNTAASKPYVLKFHATYNKPRIISNHTCTGVQNFEGKWECSFSPGTSDSSKAVGLFTMAANGSYQGTFLTETGDYRYLDGGYVDCDKIVLSGFDGQHAFLFTAKMTYDSIQGEFWSGKYWHEPWKAKRNPKFELRDPEKLTWITDSSNVNFTFNDLNGKPVSLSDPQFKGKVVIIQIMGSWCPNCMDETAWMSGVYDKYHSQGLEVVALAYERKGDTATQNAAIRRVRDRYQANYTFLNTGKSGADSASASLPFLNGIMGFPTTIYIDRSGNVRKIYTGFNGPATSSYYAKDTEEALRFIQELLAE